MINFEALADQLKIRFAWPGQSTLRVIGCDRCGSAEDAIKSIQHRRRENQKFAALSRKHGHRFSRRATRPLAGILYPGRVIDA